MRTPRRHRLTRRQSEQLLDGLGDPGDLSRNHGDLARLLADARPLRASGELPGELPGEAAALAAFRSAAVTHLDPRPRSSSVRTLSPRRSLAVKVFALAAASLAVGGVSMAATGHLPGPLKVSPLASTSARPTGTPTAAPSSHDGNADHKATDKARPTGSPTGRPAHRQDQEHAIGLCRAWSEITKNDAAALTRSARFQELVGSAGGADKVLGFCDRQTTAWCEEHRWPGAAPVQIDGTPITIRCVRPTDKPTDKPGGKPSAHPTGPINGNPGSPGKGGQPTHPGGDKPAPLPTGAPVRN